MGDTTISMTISVDGQQNTDQTAQLRMVNFDV